MTSSVWPAYVARENTLRDLQAAIAANPAALDTRFYYASFLRDHGYLDVAIVTFEQILSVAPNHIETLVALGVVFARAGRRLDARAAFERAVKIDRNHRGALVNLANMLALDEPDRARALFEAALAGDANCLPAHRGLCGLAIARGDAAAAQKHRAAGYASGPFGRRPYLGASMPISVLAYVSTDGGNIPLDALLDERTFLVHEVYVEAYRGEPLPPHQLTVNAIADADRSRAALRIATKMAEASFVPVVNAPSAVALTGRVATSARLAPLVNVIAPRARIVLRDALAGEKYPLILRTPGMHMGRGMILVPDADSLEAALTALPFRDAYIAITYAETRPPSGGPWRKYRVMAIDGELYPLHLAIADRWDVHYFSSDMHDREDYRAEEARFLENPMSVLGMRAWNALARVRDVLALAYCGIDFALAQDGRIVVFEANAGMTVLKPDPDPRFAYRVAASEAIAGALKRMFEERARR